jgi:hypothetical protein
MVHIEVTRDTLTGKKWNSFSYHFRKIKGYGEIHWLGQINNNINIWLIPFNLNSFFAAILRLRKTSLDTNLYGYKFTTGTWIPVMNYCFYLFFLVKQNNLRVSFLFKIYQIILLVSTLIGPSSVILVVSGMSSNTDCLHLFIYSIVIFFVRVGGYWLNPILGKK